MNYRRSTVLSNKKSLKIDSTNASVAIQRLLHAAFKLAQLLPQKKAPKESPTDYSVGPLGSN
ncbi:MAG TPA: hypothetical protein DIS80_03420 [Verrucomicrobiales bacterium]|nr:hypothetical protein [Verrucomicrobiales bacterium]HCN80160.1 hypothetical protein [Verrucomicrobiales bacterium]